MNNKIIIVLLMILCAPLNAQEFAYVTDSLKLRLYSEPNSNSEVLLTIESGDSVEVFEKQEGFSRVITNDGSEGWVKSAFLVEDPPEKLLYYSVSEQNKQLQAEIIALQNNSATTTSVSNEADRKQIEELQAALAKEQEVNQKLQEQEQEQEQEQVEGVGSVQPTVIKSTSTKLNANVDELFNTTFNKWFLIAIPFVLILVGFLLGIKLSAVRMRKRLHGFSFK